jgi:hypothetical protein
MEDLKEFLKDNGIKGITTQVYEENFRTNKEVIIIRTGMNKVLDIKITRLDWVTIGLRKNKTSEWEVKRNEKILDFKISEIVMYVEILKEVEKLVKKYNTINYKIDF